MYYIPLSYVVVLGVWSTTPLAIKWTAEFYTPAMALYLRLLVGLICIQLIRTLISEPKLQFRKYWRVYLWAGIGTFPGSALGPVNTI